MEKFKIEIASLPNRDELVAEIFYENLQFAEIFYENNKLMIEFYGYEKKDIWLFSFHQIMGILEEAKQKLLHILGKDIVD